MHRRWRAKREALTVFQQALIDSVLKEYGKVPAEKDLPNTFSPKFRNWVETYQKRNGFQRVHTLKVIRRILIAALIAILLAGAAMAIPAIREAVINFFFHQDGVQIGITFDPERAATAPDEIKEPYVVTYVPSVYIPVVEVDKYDCSCLIWTNGSGEKISFVQSPIPNKPDIENWWTLDGEGALRETVLLGEYWVVIVDGEECYKLVWTNNEYLFTLRLPYSVNETEMQKIFASWGPKE